MCEVFFFGTALNIESQIPSTAPARFSCIGEGRANPNDGRSGRESCDERELEIWRSSRLSEVIIVGEKKIVSIAL